MICARWTCLVAAVTSILSVSAASAQTPAPDQQPPAPTQPAPFPPPPGPGTPPQPAPPGQEEAEPVPRPETAVEPRRVPEEARPTGEPTLFGPNPFVGPDLFNPPAHQGWLSITPNFTLSAEYNDNLFLESQSPTSDFSLLFTPGVTVSVQRPAYRLLAGYNVSGQIFLNETDLNNFGQRQQFFLDGTYQIAPGWTLSLTDQFVMARESNSITASGTSAGRRDSWRNTVTPELRWQATPSTALGMFFSQTIVRYDESGTQDFSSRDSDTYRLGLEVDHEITARLTGALDVEAAYLDVEDDPAVRTYTVRPGLIYRLTPTLRATLAAGPTVIDRDGDLSLNPALSAGLIQTFKFGSMRLGYQRAVTAENIGVSDQQSVFGAITVLTLLRGLRLSFIPRYTIIDREFTNDDELKIVTLNLRATYQVARNISLIGAYTFYHETNDRTALDIDQNRVFLGVQYAFPINFY